MISGTAELNSPDYSVHVVFVCTGNICRSPMAEVMYADAIEEAGLDKLVRVSSCGIGGWHVGQGADKRTVAQLAAAGLDGSRHRASQLSDDDKNAQLIVAMEHSHVRELMAAGVARSRIALARSFDPASPPGADVDDPYYGDASDFARVYEELAAAMPGLVRWARTYAADASER